MTGFRLWEAANRWQRQMRAALDDVGLTPVQFSVLVTAAWLGQGSEPVTQRALARHARLDEMMTSQVLRALEVRGMVTREQHPTDGRARRIDVTHAGLVAANQAMQAAERADKDFFAPLGGKAEKFAKRLRALTESEAPPER